jgi:hypothetical protein
MIKRSYSVALAAAALAVIVGSDTVYAADSGSIRVPGGLCLYNPTSHWSAEWHFTKQGDVFFLQIRGEKNAQAGHANSTNAMRIGSMPTKINNGADTVELGVNGSHLDWNVTVRGNQWPVEYRSC